MSKINLMKYKKQMIEIKYLSPAATLKSRVKISNLSTNLNTIILYDSSKDSCLEMALDHLIENNPTLGILSNMSWAASDNIDYIILPLDFNILL